MTISELVKNKMQLIALKKATIKHCDAIGFEQGKQIECKSFDYDNEDNLKEGIIKRVIVGNTYNWLDSHDDVHMEGIFTKSLNESKSKVMHLHDHEYKLTAKVGEPIDVFEQKLSLTDLLLSKSGETDALLMSTEIRKDYNDFIYKQYLEGKIQQHSVGMIYVKIDLAVNDPLYKDEYSIWSKYITKVINQDKAIEKGYFWAVTEAKLIEISAVISGSNELTPTFEPASTPKEPQKEAIQKEAFTEYFINNFKL